MQVLVRRCEVSTGVDHTLIQPKRVEFGREIVVMSDNLPVSVLGVDRSREWNGTSACLPAITPWQPLQLRGEIKTLPQASLLTKKIVGQIEGSFDITLNIEIVVDVGFSQSELAG